LKKYIFENNLENNKTKSQEINKNIQKSPAKKLNMELAKEIRNIWKQTHN
jgi:hypothetical protein